MSPQTFGCRPFKEPLAGCWIQAKKALGVRLGKEAASLLNLGKIARAPLEDGGLRMAIRSTSLGRRRDKR
eukprot:3703571-Pyramimonas_sp.AAC.1